MPADPSIVRIGLLGFGCVGQGLYEILQREPAFGAVISRIAVKSPTKRRPLPTERFDFCADDLLADPTLDVLVEVIDDPWEAFRLVSTALRRGRRVVTANKAMVAQHLAELIKLQRDYGGTLLYEAAVGGSIPIIRTLESYFGREPLSSVSGILNGSSNYVLTRMADAGTTYAVALAEAQAQGFAETDPTLDMGAFDPRSKAIILAAHAYGLHLSPASVLNLGIEAISTRDIQYAAARGQKIKLVASLQRLTDGRVTALVTPQLVGPESPLYTVAREFNGVRVDAAYAGTQFWAGRGAGALPTGSAVLADLAALRAGYRYTYPKLAAAPPPYTTELELEVYLRTPNGALRSALALTDVSQDNDAFTVGYVRLDALLQFQAELLTATAFVVRTGKARLLAPCSQQLHSAELVG